MSINTSSPSIGRPAMPISKLGQRRQVVIPKEICDELGLAEGDFVEVTRAEGKIIITPKKLVDADQMLTPAQRAVIDERLAESLEDIKEGRTYGPFNSVDAMVRSLQGGTTPSVSGEAMRALTRASNAPSTDGQRF
jgi:AbrB family looped-hinge helix DNA binding protein